MTADATTATLAPKSPLIVNPILPTLARLAAPNLLAMIATSLVAVAETAYVGRLGLADLAGFALAFPMAMLLQMMSAGAMGGGVSSAVSRALGAGNVDRAEALARHALVIAGLAGLLFTAVFLIFGPGIYRLLGGTDGPLDRALTYSDTVFLGAVSIWVTNTLASILRGTGNMRVPSVVLLGVAMIQIGLGFALGLGFGPVPRLGIGGVAMAQVIAFSLGAVVFLAYLLSGRARIRLRLIGPISWDMFRDILKVGAIACVSPVQSVLTVLLMTRLVASFGTEALAGYGIGARLEFLIVPITFAIGVASVPMVGMAIGAGEVERARRVAWTAGMTAAIAIGVIGIVLAIVPDLWSELFTANAGALDVSRSYFQFAGPTYGFLGLALALYFASMGSGKIFGLVLAQTLRLLVIAIGGWWLSRTGAPLSALFAVVAASLATYGIAAALAVHLVSWGPQKARSRG